jgi:hypothetical protein
VTAFVVCVPSETATASQLPCVDVNGVYHVVSVVEYAAPGVVTFANSNQLFEYGFALVVAFWAVGAVTGSILSLIRKGQ